MSALSALYLTGDANYSSYGVLRSDKCTQEQLWNEFMNNKTVSDALSDFYKEINSNNDNSDKNAYENKMNNIPFRIVMHKLTKLKLASKYDIVKDSFNSVTPESKCKYFALIFPPKNMNYSIYNKLVNALRSNDNYFCNKLNKECVYISGLNKRLNYIDLAKLCYKNIRIPHNINKSLFVDIALNELEEELRFEESNDLQSQKTVSVQKWDNAQSFSAPLIAGIGDIKLKTPTEYEGSIQYKCRNEPSESFIDNTFKKSNKRHPIFAWVWFHLRDKRVVDDDEKHEEKHEEKYEEKEYIDVELPALQIMKKLHLKPYDNQTNIYRIEMVEYQKCYQNVALDVDRTIFYKDALVVILQCLFIPLFVIYPPLKWKRLVNKRFKLNSRSRHVGYQVRYDIASLWRYPFIFKSIICENEILFNVVSFIISLYFYVTIISGLLLYDYKKAGKKQNNYDAADHLLFFDCFGPLIFYIVATFTILWWSCQTRQCISPREHELLYHTMIATLPISKNKKKNTYDIKKTDFAPLQNISAETSLSTFMYAFRNKFFELSTPTHSLWSMSALHSKFLGIRKYVFMLLLTLPYFVVQNLENFASGYPPAFITKNEKHYYWSLNFIYCISSYIVSLIFLFGFNFLWETMFIRIERYRENVRKLADLLVKDHYSESIDLIRMNNVCSWLELQIFVKRKGMILFASLEAPLLSLWILAAFSWAGFIFCIYKGQTEVNNSLISNSAWWTWFYLALLTGFQTVRMLYWYARHFAWTTRKINFSLKAQLLTMQRNYGMQFITKNTLSNEEKLCMELVKNISQTLDLRQIIPNAFGMIRFDKLIQTTVTSLLVAAAPTIFAILYNIAQKKLPLDTPSPTVSDAVFSDYD